MWSTIWPKRSRLPLSFLFAALFLSFTSLYLQSSLELLSSQSFLDNNKLSIDTHSPPWALFYNIYIPTNKGRIGITRAMDKVQEQLNQIGTSFANNHYSNLTVFYVTIGHPINETRMKDACEKHHLRCRHVQHYDRGSESLTLQVLHDFCHQYSQHKVIYVHAKGTYHNHQGQNDDWRRHLTRAVTSRECLLSTNSDCNVCGLNFYPLWTTFFPGNFFVADCQYVQKLLPPSYFQHCMNTLVEEMINSTTTTTLSHLTANLYNPNNPGNMGVHRYASEHWIGSHPDLIPCDVSPTANVQYWLQEETTTTATKFEWSLAPRHLLNASWFRLNPDVLHDVLSDTRRYREYFLLPGFLFKWYRLYNKVPGPSSWVWDFYPDGDFWKAMVQKYGNRTLLKEVMARHKKEWSRL